MEPLKLYWLGHPLVELAGRAIKLETRKATALLSFLSLASAECQREILATMFWPEGSQQKALANLRRTLSSLHSRLPGWIEANRESIVLQRNSKLSVDVDIFRQSFYQFNEHDHLKEKVCDSCLANLEKATEIYRGEFLEGLNLSDAPDFDEWQFFQRDSLRQELAVALQHLAAGYAERGQWEQAIACSRRWVTLDRLHEPAHRALMDLYARAGQKSAAIRQYQEMARLLQEQLGQVPEQETLRLYEQVRGREDSERIIESVEDVPSFPLLKTKLYIPSVSASRVMRSSLVNRLNEVEQKALTLISAPAGFGKTTLLAEWIAQTALPVAWLSLDSGDNDPYRFISYLVAALESIQEGVGLEAQKLMRIPQLVQPHIILASLINDLGRMVEPCVLVLDDYQFITEHTVHEIISYLLDHLPANLHVVIATRADPPLQLGRLRAHDQMLELRTQDLRFDPEEAGEFLNDVMKLGISAEDINALEARTEGWVTGLQMAALSLKGHENANEFIRAFSGTHRYVLDYLMEEVLKRQPAHIQTFLLETSILEKLSGPLCDALMVEEGRRSGENGQAVLEYLERNNLFLVSMDDQRNWFRYHHLFADLLKSRLKQSDPQLEAACHQQAARWFAENSFRVEAVDHALAARDFPTAADFIEKFALSLIGRNEIRTITRWFNSLPLDLVQTRPRLIIYHALVMARLGDSNDLENTLQEAESMLGAGPQFSDLNELRNYLTQLRTYLANTRSDVDLAIKIALGTKEPPEQIDTFSTDVNYGSLGFPVKEAGFGGVSVRTHAHTPKSGYLPRKFLESLNYLIGLELGIAYYSKGDLEGAEQIFQSVAKSAEIVEDTYNAMVARMELANIRLLRGRMVQAEEIYDRIQEWLARNVENRAMFEGALKVSRANILFERNELQEASRVVREGINEALRGFLTNTVAYGYTTLAKILRAQGDIHRAREAVEKASIQVQDRRTYPKLVKHVKICQVNQWLAEGDLTAAQSWAREEFQAPYSPASFSRELEHMTLARVLLANKQSYEASRLLDEMAQAAEAGRREGRLIEINILRALALHGLGQDAEALRALDSSLVKAQPEGYFRIFLDEGPPLKYLLECGKQQGIWKEPALCVYVDKLLASL